MGVSRHPVRTCVVHRVRRPIDELLRLALFDGRIVLDPNHQLPGRGAWVSASGDALSRLEARPEMAWRTLRVRQVPTGPLLQPARDHSRLRVTRALLHCHRSGLLRSIPSLAQPLPEPDSLLAILRPTDPVTPEADRVTDLEKGWPVLSTGLTGPTIQDLLRCAPPMLLLLRPGKPSRHLLRELRRLEALG